MLVFIQFFLQNWFVSECAIKNLAKIPCWRTDGVFLLDVEELIDVLLNNILIRKYINNISYLHE